MSDRRVCPQREGLRVSMDVERLGEQAESPPDLSVLIVNYNGGSMLSDCLRSVRDTVSESSLEIIVVDNCSTDGSMDEARREFPEVTYIQNDHNNWFTGATNQAIRASRGNYLLCLNPDTVCHEGALDSMVAFLRDHPSAGVVGPMLLNGDGSLQPSCRKFLKSRYLLLKHLLPWRILPNSWKRRVVLEYWDHRDTIRSDWIIGACLLARRSAVEEVGLKDEGFPMFHEETDWCYRMLQEGWETWYLHTARVTHFGSQSAMEFWGDELILEFYKGKHRFIRKHFGAAALFCHRLLLSGLLSLRLAGLLLRRIAGSDPSFRREKSFLLGGLAIQLGLKGGDPYSGPVDGKGSG